MNSNSRHNHNRRCRKRRNPRKPLTKSPPNKSTKHTSVSSPNPPRLEHIPSSTPLSMPSTPLSMPSTPLSMPSTPLSMPYQVPTTTISLPSLNRTPPNQREHRVTIEWLVENQSHEDFWKKAHKAYGEPSYDTFREKTGKKSMTYVNQKGLLEINRSRMKEIYSKNIYSEEQLFNIIIDNKCLLIKKLKVPKEILKVIVSFVGNGIIPICYSLSYLPWYHAICPHSLYTNSLKNWWNEIRTNKDHKGIFYPTELKTASEEFRQFFTTRLSKDGIDKINGKRIKYHRCTIPTFAMDVNTKILQQCYKDLSLEFTDINKAIQVNLPTASGSSKCIGGIELFQRLYLETLINPQYNDCLEFNVDLVLNRGRHGDGWCFDGNGYVAIENNKYKRICELKIGDNVCSFPGNRISKIKCIIVSIIDKEIEMVELYNNCWITFEHPVLTNVDYNNMCKYKDMGNKLDSNVICQYNLFWKLPKHMFQVQYRYQNKIYNFVLDSNHTLNVNGNWCCTLGHDYKGDVIQHDFWGDSKAVEQFLRANSYTYPYVVFQ